MRKGPISRIALIVLATISICALGYAFAAPVFVKGFGALRPRELNLDQANSYYSVLSAFVSFGAGLAGIVLGYFYFKGRLRFDDQSRVRDRQRAQLGVLLARLDRVDDVMGRVIQNGSSEEEQAQNCQRLLRELDQIVAMLEDAERLMGLDDEDIRSIVKLNTVVEHHARWAQEQPVLHAVDSTEVNTRRSGDMEIFSERLQEARARCIRRIS